MTDTGFITRNLISGSPGNLDLFTGSPLAVYDFVHEGLNPGQAQQRRQSCETAFHPGAGLLSAWPGMASASLQFIVTGPDGPTLDENIGALVEAVYTQIVWELHVSFEGTRPWAWRLWKADEPQIGMQASWWSEGPEPIMWAPVTVTAPRDPAMLAGPYQDV